MVDEARIVPGEASAEMIAAWTEYECPYHIDDLPQAQVAAIIRHAFISGWKAATPSAPPADLEAESRELLAAEFEAAKLHSAAKSIREFGDSQGWSTNPDAVISRALRAIQRALSARQIAQGVGSFQDRVQPWMLECFTAEIAADKLERSDRAVEEMLELSQAVCASIGVDFAPRAHALVDYVASRPVGEPNQEVGGVMVTLAALCLAVGLDMHEAGETELARISAPETIAKIRAKQAAKPTGSALPIASPPPSVEAAAMVERLAEIAEHWTPPVGAWPGYDSGTAHRVCREIGERLREKALALITRLSGGEVERLREALERIAVGDEPRPIGKQWRNDGKPSKNDKCTHDVWMYETCGNCVSECARASLTPKEPTP